MAWEVVTKIIVVKVFLEENQDILEIINSKILEDFQGEIEHL